MRTLTSTELMQTNGAGTLSLELSFNTLKNTIIEPGLAGAAFGVVLKFLTEKSFSGTATLSYAGAAVIAYNVFTVADVFTLN